MVGAGGASLESWTARVTVTLAPLWKLKVTGTGCAGYNSWLSPTKVTVGPPLPIPICTDWRPGSSIGALPADPPEEPDADAEPLAGGVAGTLAELELDAEPELAEGDAAEADEPPAELAAEAPLNWAPEATVEVTETSLSGLSLRLMITIRSGAVAPLA